MSDVVGDDPIVEQVAEAIAEQADDYYWSLLTPDEREPYFERARAAIEALGLTEEDRWTPVCADGTRWVPRDKESAEAALAVWGEDSPANVCSDLPGVTHIEYESRLVGPWRVGGDT